MIDLATARRSVLDACPALPPEVVPLPGALGCVTATAVTAALDVPAFANSAMDGYALRAADTDRAPIVLRVVGVTLAGMAPAELGPGEAVRVMTGAPLPRGADAVCMLEHTDARPRDAEVRIATPVRQGQFVRERGDDLRRGEQVFAPGTALRPGHLGVLASLGLSQVEVVRRPVVGVLSSGDELLEPPEPLTPGRIRDANRPTLTSLVQRADCRAVDLGIVPDDRAAIERALTVGGVGCDAMVVSGGVSVGDADLVTAALDRLCGGGMHWMQIAIKPAKPFAFGRLAAGRTPVFGLPGNPVSAMVSFELLVRPALRQMAGHATLDRPVALAVADEDLPREVDGKTHFLRVEAVYDASGVLHVRPSGVQQSHVLHAMALGNGLAVVPDGAGVPAGRQVHVMLLDLDSTATAEHADGLGFIAAAPEPGALKFRNS